MLNQAAKSGEDHVLLKLDVIKEFDRLEWPFLLQLIHKVGMTGLLSRFLVASFASASSWVLLNGRETEHFALKHFVRQGCPLSPLLFILAFDVLGDMLTQALNNGTIQGVYFPGVNAHTLQIKFADDLNAIIKACIIYIEAFQLILRRFEAFSGLMCAWDQTVAVCISPGPPHPALWLLPWKWEDNKTATRSLGVPVAHTIVIEKPESFLLSILEGKLNKLKLKFLTLVTRATVANRLLLNCLWYLLIIWAGKDKFLAKLQKVVDNFLWNGRSRVANVVVSLPK